MDRPKFLKSLLEAWQLSYDDGGWRALVPYWLVASSILGVWAAWSLPNTFWNGQKPEVPIAVMAGILTFDGLILALSWSSFSKIFEIIGAGEFSAFLRRHKLLSQYMVTVGWVHGAQIVAISATGFALLAPVLALKAWAMQSAFALAIGSTIYAIKQGVSASTVMQDLIWQKSQFDAGQKQSSPVRPLGGASSA